MLRELTDAQKARFPEFVEKWTRIGLSTEPADRPNAEAAIRQMYATVGMEPPCIVWCGSPMGNALTRAVVLTNTGKIAKGGVITRVRDSVRNRIWQSVEASGISKDAVLSVGDSVGDSVAASIADSVGASVWTSVKDSVGDSVWASVANRVRDSVAASVAASVVNRVRGSVLASVGASVWPSVRDSVGDSVWASVGDSVRDSVLNSVGDSVWASVQNSVGDSVLDSVAGSVWAGVWASVANSVANSVAGSVWGSVWARVGDSVGDSVGASVLASVQDSVQDSVRDSAANSVRDSVWASAFGCDDAHWLAFYDYFREVCGLVESTSKLEGLWLLAKSAGWILPHRNICWVSERRCILHRDDAGRIHSTNGPAIAYPDGWEIYAIHGTTVPGAWVRNPSSLTPAVALFERNVERRRAACELLGWERIMAELSPTVIDRDPDPEIGELLQVDHSVIGREKFLRVRCGTGRQFCLAVPPSMETALQANAWTWGLSSIEYNPEVRT